MSVFAKISINLRDLVRFGPQFLLRHMPRLTGAHTARVRIPGYFDVHLRAGESDVASIRQVFGDRGYDIGGISLVGARIWRRYTEILNEGRVPVVVDAGANIGAASLWFQKEYPGAGIVAIEPEPGNLNVLQMNTRSNANIRVLAAAVASSDGFVAVQKNDLGWATRTERALTGIPIVTMAQAFRSVENGTPFIAKIDIEGFESDLFSKNIEWLDEVFVVFIEPHDWMLPGKMTSRNFQRALGERDFEIFICGEALAFVRV